jgi:hypothetical protein
MFNAVYSFSTCCPLHDMLEPKIIFVRDSSFWSVSVWDDNCLRDYMASAEIKGLQIQITR